MIPAVVQTLAEILSNGTSLISKERIDFSHPQFHSSVRPALNLYCYDVRDSSLIQIQTLGHQTHGIDSKPLLDPSEPESPRWFDLSFLISAWDSTALGEQRLLSETLQILLDYRVLPEEALAPGLRGYGSLPIQVSTKALVDITALWRALGVPLRPALHVTVAVPFPCRDSTYPQAALRAVISNTNCPQGALPLPP
jgi:hypothetical protein